MDFVKRLEESYAKKGITIDFLKWLISQSTNFIMYKLGDMCIVDYHGIMSRPVSGMDMDLAMWPLLLQEAIEGFNTKQSKYKIIADDCTLTLINVCVVIAEEKDGIRLFTKAKEQILMYAYKEEVG